MLQQNLYPLHNNHLLCKDKDCILVHMIIRITIWYHDENEMRLHSRFDLLSARNVIRALLRSVPIYLRWST